MSLKDKASRIKFGRTETTSLEHELSVVIPEAKTKTAPGAMMSFANDRRSEMLKENEELKKRIGDTNLLQDRLDETLEELQQWDGAKAVRALDPKLIGRSKFANRHEVNFQGSDFSLLKDEIASAGKNIQPIKVRPVADKSSSYKYEIVFGHRRHEACRQLNIPVHAVLDNLDDQALFVEMDRENRLRADLRPYEQGVMYARALDDGLFPSLRKMAEALGVDPGNASKAISLARLPQPILDAFESPLDIQQSWSTQLTSLLKTDPDIVLSRASALSKIVPRLSSAQVFKDLLGEGVVSNNTPAHSSVVVKGQGGKVGKITFNPKRNTFEISLTGFDADQMKAVEKAIKSLL